MVSSKAQTATLPCSSPRLDVCQKIMQPAPRSNYAITIQVWLQPPTEHLFLPDSLRFQLGFAGSHSSTSIELASFVELLLGDPLAKVSDTLAKQEDDYNASSNTEANSNNTTGTPSSYILSVDILSWSWIKEVISVESLGGMCHICNSKISSQDNNQPDEVYKWWWVDSRKDKLKEGEGRVEAMLGDVDPETIRTLVWSTKEQCPVDNSDDEWERYDRGEEKVM